MRQRQIPLSGDLLEEAVERTAGGISLRRRLDYGGRGRLHLGATKYLSGILALDVQLRRTLSASSIRARPGCPWRVGRSRPNLRRRLRRLNARAWDAAHGSVRPAHETMVVLPDCASQSILLSVRT